MKEVDLSNIDSMSLDDIEDLLDEEKEETTPKSSNNEPPENELEFNDRLITPSDKVQGVPTISRELLSTNIDSTTARVIQHYDKVQVKYDILKHIQVAKRKDFMRTLKEKIRRSKLYGFPLNVFEREFTGEEVDYKRVIHMIASSGKSIDGFSVKTIKTDYKKSIEDIKSLEINREEQLRKRKGLPW